MRHLVQQEAGAQPISFDLQTEAFASEAPSAFTKSTQLHLAILQEDVKAAKDLMKTALHNDDSFAELVEAQDDEGCTALHLACYNDCDNLVEAIIKIVGINTIILHNLLKIQDNCGNTPFHAAAQNLSNVKRTIHYSMDIVQRLLITGNKFKETPLHLATRNNKVRNVEAILGTSSHNRTLLQIHLIAKDNVGNTVLHLAYYTNDPSMANAILDVIGDYPGMLHTLAQVPNNSNDIPLHLAAKQDHINILLKLMDNLLGLHSLLMKQNIMGNTPMHIAIRAGNFNFVGAVFNIFVHHPVLLQNLLDCRNKLEETPFFTSVAYNKYNIAELILEFAQNDRSFLNAQLDATNETGVTPLQYAIAKKRGTMAIMILDYANQVDVLKSQLDTTDCFGDDLLQLCCAAKDTKFVDTVFQIVSSDQTLFHDQLVMKRKSGELLLHLVIIHQHTLVALNYLNYAENNPDLLQYFLEATDSAGNTPLHLAILNNLTKIVERILELLQNNTPLLTRLFTATNNKKHNVLHCAALKNAWKEAKHILESSCGMALQNHLIYSRDTHGFTPMHLDMRENHGETIFIILYVIKYNLKTLTEFLNDRRYGHYTLLQFAAIKGYYIVVDNILKAIADIPTILKGVRLLRDSWGNTIAHLAAANGDVEVLKMLIKSAEGNQSDITMLLQTQNKQGCTVYQTAALNNQEAVIEYIQELTSDYPNFLRCELVGRDAAKNTLLHHIAKLGHAEALVTIVKDARESPTLTQTSLLMSRNKDGFTVFHMAAAAGKKDVLKAIIKSLEHNPTLLGKLFLAKDKFDRTAFSLAVEKGNPEIIALFKETIARHSYLPSGVEHLIDRPHLCLTSSAYLEHPRDPINKSKINLACELTRSNKHKAIHDNCKKLNSNAITV